MVRLRLLERAQQRGRSSCDRLLGRSCAFGSALRPPPLAGHLLCASRPQARGLARRGVSGRQAHGLR